MTTGMPINQRIDCYRLIHLIGSGGYGKVYLAERIQQESSQLSTQVAVKILPPLAQENLGAFLTEARMIRLKHPHVMAILDFGLDGQTPFLVMEYAPYGTLRKRYPMGSRLPLTTIDKYVTQIASALQVAHQEQIIHRDVKPENMLLTQPDHVVLSDFGIAAILQHTTQNQSLSFAGTAHYMAPEQSLGEPCAASDQYALAIVVYEWLCGERPFQGTSAEIIAQHITRPVPSLQKRWPAITPELEAIILKALAKDPAHRYATIENFAQALHTAIVQAQLQVGADLQNDAADDAFYETTQKRQAVSRAQSDKTLEGEEVLTSAPNAISTLKNDSNSIGTDTAGDLVRNFHSAGNYSFRSLNKKKVLLLTLAALLIFAGVGLAFFHPASSTLPSSSPSQPKATLVSTMVTQKTAVLPFTATAIPTATPSPTITPTPLPTATPVPTPVPTPTPPTPTAQSSNPTPQPTPVSPPLTDQVPDSAIITCGGLRTGSWTVENNPYGYVGPTHTGSSCDGSFSYILTPTSAYTIFFKDTPIPAGKQNVDAWVFIPTHLAGAYKAKYTLTIEDTSKQSIASQSWFINQQNTNYWKLLGTVSLPNNAKYLTLTVSSTDTEVRDLAENAAAINFR